MILRSFARLVFGRARQLEDRNGNLKCLSRAATSCGCQNKKVNVHPSIFRVWGKKWYYPGYAFNFLEDVVRHDPELLSKLRKIAHFHSGTPLDMTWCLGGLFSGSNMSKARDITKHNNWSKICAMYAHKELLSRVDRHVESLLYFMWLWK